ncbi:hypothetical protein BKA80DRAFT_144634 [Phyllosticta citrichinensis]
MLFRDTVLLLHCHCLLMRTKILCRANSGRNDVFPQRREGARTSRLADWSLPPEDQPKIALDHGPFVVNEAFVPRF